MPKTASASTGEADAVFWGFLLGDAENTKNWWRMGNVAGVDLRDSLMRHELNKTHF